MSQKVSVVIPTIGNTKMIKRSVDSVLSQTFTNIEIIIVMDGSSNAVQELIRNYNNDNIKLIETGKNLGGGAARNIGVKAATGKWVALLDDDDEWYSTKIEKQMNEFSGYTIEDNVFCFTASLAYKSEEDNIKLPKKIWAETYTIDEYLFNLKRGQRIGFIQTSTIMASKKYFLNNLFDESLPKHQDWDWLLNAQKKSNNKVIYIDEILNKYHLSNEKSVSKKNIWKFSEKWIENKKKEIKRESYDSFLIVAVIEKIIEDKNLSRTKKFEEIKRIYKKLSTQGKLNVRHLRNVILFLSF